jgi:hypothetical protein
MIIQVKYSDGTVDRVQSMLLDTLILGGVITKFRRTNGWVIIGQDQIRNHRGDKNCVNEERRTDLPTLSFL